MREILFRGKRKDNGKWVEGDLLKYSTMTIIQTKEQINLLIRLEAYPVESSTVGEFTGLYDKNGKRIFEGDIVEGIDFSADDDGYGIVEMSDGGFLVSNEFICGSFIENYNGRDFEVIGNIHDNTELIGGHDNV